MKQTLLILLCWVAIGNAYSQGITLLYKGGGSGDWNDPINWIQINTPAGQIPIKRAPPELDDVVFSKSQSGISTVMVVIPSGTPDFNVGAKNSTGNRCKSMHVSNTDLTFDSPAYVDGAPILNVYTTNKGYVNRFRR